MCIYIKARWRLFIKILLDNLSMDYNDYPLTRTQSAGHQNEIGL